MPFSRGSSQPEREPRSSTLQADSLPSEPPGKPKNIGVGSLTLLQGIFLTQELNWGLLHCRQILYQLSYQGSPGVCLLANKQSPQINILLCLACIPSPPKQKKNLLSWDHRLRIANRVRNKLFFFFFKEDTPGGHG